MTEIPPDTRRALCMGCGHEVSMQDAVSVWAETLMGLTGFWTHAGCTEAVLASYEQATGDR